MLHLADHIKSTYREGLVNSSQQDEYELGVWNANLVCKSQAHIPYEQRQCSIRNLPGETERIDERFESKGYNIGTFKKGHGYRALAGFQNTTWAYLTPVRWKKLGGNEHQASGAEGNEHLQIHSLLVVEYMGASSTKSTGVWEEAVAAVNWWYSVLETEERGSGG